MRLRSSRDVALPLKWYSDEWNRRATFADKKGPRVESSTLDTGHHAAWVDGSDERISYSAPGRNEEPGKPETNWVTSLRFLGLLMLAGDVR